LDGGQADSNHLGHGKLEELCWRALLDHGEGVKIYFKRVGKMMGKLRVVLDVKAVVKGNFHFRNCRRDGGS